MLDFKIGFIGAGNMALALAKNFVRAGLVDRKSIFFNCRTESRLETLSSDGFQVVYTYEKLLQNCEIIILATKPYQISNVSQALHKLLSSDSSKLTSLPNGRETSDLTVTDKLFISVCANITFSQLIQSFPFPEKNTFRVMPNLPCSIGSGATVFCCSESASNDKKEVIKTLFSSCGLLYEVSDHLIDVATGISGAGPAFVCTMIEAMAYAGIACGLPSEISYGLASQTVSGTGQLIQQQKLHPAVLRDQVSSPGGVTASGMIALESGNFRSAVISAVKKAVDASRHRF